MTGANMFTKDNNKLWKTFDIFMALQAAMQSESWKLNNQFVEKN